jgi:hypothetical protein
MNRAIAAHAERTGTQSGVPPLPYLATNRLESAVYQVTCLQNRHNKGLIAKFVQINKLAPEDGGVLRGLPFFLLF